MMHRVRTPSRLHFGLLSLPATDDRWPDLQECRVVPARSFGGVGLMIDRPGVRVAVEPSDAWAASGPSSERALRFARQIRDSLQDSKMPLAFRISVEACPREHVGLGTGTQLGLAVARAVANACGQSQLDVATLARAAGRGRRSAIGVHGFAHGGLLVDGGKRTSDVAPLLVRRAFPTSWRIVLVVPPSEQGVHGQVERRAFSESLQLNLRQTDALCRLLLLGILPAVVEEDLEAFGEALYDYNRRSGEMFCPVQHGLYAATQTEAVVDFIRRSNVPGAGQSSWGPTVFAVTDAHRAEHLAGSLVHHFGFDETEVIVTQACQHGAVFNETVT